MPTYERWVQRRILIVARTYPVPARKSIEVSCTAGITEDGKLVRLFPIPYRFLDEDKRFRKYQYIEAKIAKSESDTRPESYHIDTDSIKIVSEPLPTANNWEARKAEVMPLKTHSLCRLQAERDLNKEPTLGFFKPKRITALKIDPTSSAWTPAELGRLRQYSLFGNAPKTELEKLPVIFSYEFQCGEVECNVHTLSCTDWEVGAAYRGWRNKYGVNWEEKFRNRFEREMILKNDTHFFVGTLRNHPDAWIIISLFYPPK
jgi:hypothetical protein